jgi:hypothetical protein
MASLYSSYAGLAAADGYLTWQAVHNGAIETNPVVAPIVRDAPGSRRSSSRPVRDLSPSNGFAGSPQSRDMDRGGRQRRHGVGRVAQLRRSTTAAVKDRRRGQPPAARRADEFVFGMSDREYGHGAIRTGVRRRCPSSDAPAPSAMRPRRSGRCRTHARSRRWRRPVSPTS